MMHDELTTLLEPAIEQLGYELVDQELQTGGKDGLLRIFIDAADGVDLDSMVILVEAK